MDSLAERVFTYKHAEENPIIHAAVCCAEIFDRKDYGTGKLKVCARVCTAPDCTTVLSWPFTMDSEGYMSKTELKKIHSAVKRELKVWLKSHNVRLTEPLREEVL